MESFSFNHIPLPVFMTYGLLALAIAFAWSRKNIIKIKCLELRFWMFFLALSMIYGVSTHLLTLTSVLVVGLYLALVFAARKFASGRTRFLLMLTLIMLSLALALHLVPGFPRIVVFYERLLGSSNTPFTLHANYDKAIVGLALLAVLAKKVKSFKSFKGLVQKHAIFLALSVVLIFSISWLLGLNVDPKFDQAILAFYGINLLFACVAEEGFFRLLIQDNLSRILRNFRYRALLTVSITTTLFTLAHWGFVTELKPFLMVAVAGLAYALVYQRSQSIEFSIMTHFMVNALHITFFVYPI